MSEASYEVNFFPWADNIMRLTTIQEKCAQHRKPTATAPLERRTWDLRTSKAPLLALQGIPRKELLEQGQIPAGDMWIFANHRKPKVASQV